MYNILDTFSIISLLNAGLDNIGEIISSYKPRLGRNEMFSIDGVPVILNLSKNRVGLNQNISAMLNDPRQKDVIVAVNDNGSDGKDVSWLWDVDFERMTEKDFSRFSASGGRAEDVYIRMKHADIPLDAVLFEKDCEKATKELLKDKSEVMYVLVNYTLLFGIWQFLKKYSKTGGEMGCNRYELPIYIMSS